MIAPGCIFSDAQHGYEDISIPMKIKNAYSPIEIADVWIGSGSLFSVEFKRRDHSRRVSY